MRKEAILIVADNHFFSDPAQKQKKEWLRCGSPRGREKYRGCGRCWLDEPMRMVTRLVRMSGMTHTKYVNECLHRITILGNMLRPIASDSLQDSSVSDV